MKKRSNTIKKYTAMMMCPCSPDVGDCPRCHKVYPTIKKVRKTRKTRKSKE